LFRRREEPLEFGEGGRSLLTLGAKGLIAEDGFRPGVSGFFLDGRRETANGERLVFRLGLHEGRPLDVERPPGDLDGVLESRVCLFGFRKTLPQETLALVRVQSVVPPPEFIDHDGGIAGRSVDQGLCRAEGIRELLSQEERVRDRGRATHEGNRRLGRDADAAGFRFRLHRDLDRRALGHG